MCCQRLYVERGGSSIVYHGPDLHALFRGAAGDVDLILKDTRPSGLPVQQASKFDLVINRNTAEAMVLKISHALPWRAAEAIR